MIVTGYDAVPDEESAVTPMPDTRPLLTVAEPGVLTCTGCPTLMLRIRLSPTSASTTISEPSSRTAAVVPADTRSPRPTASPRAGP